MEKEIIEYLYSLDWSNYHNIEFYNQLNNQTERFNKKLTSISYSKEEIDYFIEQSNDTEYEDRFLRSLRYDFEVEKIKVTANIATKRDRFDSLLLTLDSIKGQFDEIRIYLNDYQDIPEELRSYNVFLGPDLTDNAKLIWSDNENEYYFTIDDDIIYPSDYVEKTLPLIGDRVVCYSGKKINTSCLDNYYANHRDYDTFEKMDEEVDIDIVDTSTMAFNTNYFYSNLWRTPINKMSDLILSLEATLHQVPIVCLPHQSNWIKRIYREGIRKEFFDNEDEQVRLLKMISTYKNLKTNDLDKSKIFGTISSESIELLSSEIKKLGKDIRTLYHIGSGIGTNLLHLTFLLDFENYIGINSEEYRTRFAKRTYHGKRKDFKGQINFFKSDLEKIMFDEKSIILFNPFITQKIISQLWNNIPIGSFVISFHKLLETTVTSKVNIELLNGEKREIYFYKKVNGDVNAYEFRNIPFKYKDLITKKISSEIPKIVHHIAPADKSKWHYKWENCYQSWLQHFPDFEHKMWDDEDIEKFISDNYPWYLTIYKSYDRNIKRYDVARILILHYYGGIYADMDYIVYKNFYDEMPKDKVSTPISPYRLHEFVQNALFIGPKNHIFWMMCIDLSINRTHISSVLDATGPKLISDCYYEFYPICKDMVNILPCEKYNPSWRTPEYESDELITKHLCSNSWTLKVRPGVIWTDDFI